MACQVAAKIESLSVANDVQNQALTVASVIYGLAEDYTGKLHKSEMRRVTPYNTYLYKGLPPTPIAMPGLASIQAALYQTITDHVFYVTKGDGGHYFSTSLLEHNKAIQQSNRNKRVKSEVKLQASPLLV